MSEIIKAYGLLDDNQYYHTTCNKTRIVLHHTAGGSAESSIDWWNKYRDHICTPYIIDRNGRILELFPPEYWAYALGINSSWAEKKSIHIELCNYGWLVLHNDKLFRQIGNKLYPFDGEHVQYNQKHRGYLYFEKYTSEQISSLMYLLEYLSKRFNIKVNDVEKFWWYDKNTSKSLISHTTVRKDKSDIHPQPDLIKAIYDFAGCDAPITE